MAKARKTVEFEPFQRNVFLHQIPPTNREPGMSKIRHDPPWPGAIEWEQSVFYWWWKFLRVHPGYQATCRAMGDGEYTRVYEHFGDLADDDFGAWFRKRGSYLFGEPLSKGAKLLGEGEAADHMEGYVYIAVPRQAPLTSSVEQIRDILRKELDRLPSKSGEDNSRARYPVIRKVSMQTLYNAYRVLETLAANKGTPLSDWELAKKAGIVVNKKVLAATVRTDQFLRSGGDAKEELSKYGKHYRQIAESIMKEIVRTDNEAKKAKVRPGRYGVFPAFKAKEV